MNPLIAYARQARDLLYGVKSFNCPAHLRANQRSLAEGEEQQLIRSLKENYFSYEKYFPDPVETYLSTEDGRGDLSAHVSGRLNGSRQTIVPWIDDTIQLEGAKVLEIGCGTGSSTVALAEQGAAVVAADIHAGSLRVAEDRLKAHGLQAELLCASASDALAQSDSAAFDIVAFIAVLEHMTLQERLGALSQAWASLRSGGCLIVQETPNRLWYFDDHTSQEHFFMWLPDDVAIRYSAQTPRKRYRHLFRDVDYESDSTRLDFARWGRGISYHDFVLAFSIEPSRLPVASCMELFVREKTRTGRLYRNTPWRKYEEMLSSMRPEIHRGFYLKYLDLIFRKP